MSGEDDSDAAGKPAPKPEAANREARLAQALRANLRRRKVAARPQDERPAKG